MKVLVEDMQNSRIGGCGEAGQPSLVLISQFVKPQCQENQKDDFQVSSSLYRERSCGGCRSQPASQNFILLH